MSTGAHHYTEAEKALAASTRVNRRDYKNDSEAAAVAQTYLARAQVHATLALAAATALAGVESMASAGVNFASVEDDHPHDWLAAISSEVS